MPPPGELLDTKLHQLQTSELALLSALVNADCTCDYGKLSARETKTPGFRLTESMTHGRANGTR